MSNRVTQFMTVDQLISGRPAPVAAPGVMTPAEHRALGESGASNLHPAHLNVPRKLLRKLLVKEYKTLRAERVILSDGADEREYLEDRMRQLKTFVRWLDAGGELESDLFVGVFPTASVIAD